MQSKRVVQPDYTKSNINVTSALFHYYGLSCKYAVDQDIAQELKKEYTTVVYLVLDGLGTKIMDDNLKPLSFLTSKLLKEVSSVYPSSTVPSTTAIQTGMAPNESGWLGWQQHFEGKYKGDIEMFIGEDFYTKEKIKGFDGRKMVPTKPLQEIVKKAKGYTYMDDQIMEGGYHNFKELTKWILKAGSDDEKKYIYAYYQDPDHTMHEYGSRSEQAKKVINKLDRQLKHMYKKMNDKTLVIITADHGQRDVKYHRLNDYPKLMSTLERLPSLEGRAASFTLKKGKQKQFLQQMKQFGNEFAIYSKKDLAKNHLLGLFESHKDYDKFMGDYLVTACGDYNFYYDTGKIDHLLIGHHGGQTIDEMRVPVIVLSKK
ncbi:MAG: alkaline phosphatase family protein [Bacilli bacterium]